MLERTDSGEGTIVRILVIGARGLVGSAAVAALRDRHEVIEASRSTTPAVDVTDPASIEALFAAVGPVDAVVSAVGSVPFGAVTDLTAEQYLAAFQNKVAPQLAVVRAALPHLADGGSLTLTSGVLARRSIPSGAAASLANGALEAFVQGATASLPRGIRINVVSPSVLETSTAQHTTFAGFRPVSDAEVGRAYAEAVEGDATGTVIAVD